MDKTDCFTPYACARGKHNIMSLSINLEHNHLYPLRSTVYHNNILHHAASTLDHCHTLPAKGTRNTALMSVSAEGIFSHTHTQSGRPAPSWERGKSGVMFMHKLFQCLCKICCCVVCAKVHSWRSPTWFFRVNGRDSLRGEGGVQSRKAAAVSRGSAEISPDRMGRTNFTSSLSSIALASTTLSNTRKFYSPSSMSECNLFTPPCGVAS